MAGRSPYDDGDNDKPLSLVPRIPKHILQSVSESCVTQSIGAAVGGVAMGVGMGVFVATFAAGHGELIGSGMAQQVLPSTLQLSFPVQQQFSVLRPMSQSIDLTLFEFVVDLLLIVTVAASAPSFCRCWLCAR